jgi:hypothetical protein
MPAPAPLMRAGLSTERSVEDTAGTEERWNAKDSTESGRRREASEGDLSWYYSMLLSTLFD